MLDVGKTPIRLVLKPDGGEIFAVNYDGSSFSEIDTSTNEVGGAYMVGTHPVAGIATADNSLLYVSDFDADSLGVYSIDDGELLPVAPRTGDGPESMAFSKAGNLLFVVDARSGDVAVIRTSTNSLLNMFPVGAKPNDIADKAFISGRTAQLFTQQKLRRASLSRRPTKSHHHYLCQPSASPS